MIELNDRTRYKETVSLFNSYASSRDDQCMCINRLYESLIFYRRRALDLVCEKIVLDNLCDGHCNYSDCEYCGLVYDMIDSESI